MSDMHTSGPWWIPSSQQNKTSAISRGNAVILAVIAGLIGGVFGASSSGSLFGNSIKLSSVSSAIERPPGSVADIAKRVIPSVVSLTSKSGANGSTGTGGAGGTGGGGTGSNYQSGSGGVGGTGTPNTGGGGGGYNGTVQGGSSSTGGTGGKGIIIISVPTSAYSGITTGSPTVTPSGTNTIITFLNSGTYTA